MSYLGVGLSLLDSLGATASDTLVSSILSTAGKSVGAAALHSLGVALPYITSGLDAGMSANQIQDILSAAGIGVNRSNLLGVVKILRTEYGYPSYIPGSEAANFPDASTFRFAIGRYQLKYNHVLSVIIRNSETGEEETVHITLSSDQLLTMDQIDEYVMSYGLGLQGSDKIASDFPEFDATIAYSVDNVFVTP